MKYLKLFVDFVDCLEELDDAERGRLFTAMLLYARDGEAPALPGNERFLWSMARQQLDRTSEQYQRVCAANAANARKKSAARQEAAPLREQPASREREAAPAGDIIPLREDAAPGWRGGLLPAEGPAGPTFVADTLPLAKGDRYILYPDKLAEWRRRFPSVDLPEELARMRAWLTAHPDRLTARKDVIPFILRWLEKADKRGVKPAREIGGIDIEEIRRLMLSNTDG